MAQKDKRKKNMNPQKEKLTGVLVDGRVFYVPFYQRAYVWNVKLWKRFIKDMEYVTVTPEEYFLGSIILKDKGAEGIETDRQEVIDGQQRLTTIAIFMKVLSLRDPSVHNLFDKKFRLDDGTLTIKHSLSDKDAFEKIANLTEDISLEGEDDSNLIKAYNYFRANIDLTKININSIQARTVFICIHLDNNENEHRIFDTINSLAMKLNTEELLKNHLFKESTFPSYNSIWKPVFEMDTNCLNYWKTEYSIGRNTKKTISEGFFYTLLQIIMHDPRNNVSSEEKKEFRRYDDENLFEHYKKIISSGNWDLIEFAKEITIYANLYKQIFTKDIQTDSDACKTPLKRILLMVFALDANTVLPYILYILNNVSDTIEQNKIFELLESYIVRRQICRCNSNNYSDLFTENLIGQQIKSFNDLAKYLKDRNSSLYMPSDKEVKECFHTNNKLSSVKARCILYLLESKLRAANPYQTALHHFNQYSTEHLMPQNWIANWTLPEGLDDMQKLEFTEERNRVINTLGNLAILTQGLNSAISDSEWEKKKNGTSRQSGLVKYASDLITLKDVVTKTEWNENTIKERADWLAEKANSIWKSLD